MTERQKWLRKRARRIMDRKGIPWEKALKAAEAEYVPPKPPKKTPQPRPEPKPKRGGLQTRTIREYHHRDALLKELGYLNYGNYLRSETWAQIRQRVLKAANWTCFLCGGKADTAHRASYSRNALTGKSLGLLYAVCNQCHNRTHYQDGKPRPLTQSIKDFGYTHAEPQPDTSRPRGDGGRSAPTSRARCPGNGG